MDEQVGRVPRVLFRLPVGASRGSLVHIIESRTLKEARWDDTSRTPLSRLVQDPARLRALLEHVDHRKPACGGCESHGSQHRDSPHGRSALRFAVLDAARSRGSRRERAHLRSRLRVELLVLPLACLDPHGAGCRTRRRCIRTSTGDEPRTEAGGHSDLAHDEQGTIALALHDAGYRTGIFGKYFDGFPGVVEPGWDQMGVFQGSPMGGRVLPLFPLREERSGDAHRTSRDRQEGLPTQVIADKAMGFLRGTAPGHPFFLYVAPFAPHAAIVPAPRDIGSWADYRPHLRASFNESNVSDKPRYIRERPRVAKRPFERRFRRPTSRCSPSIGWSKTDAVSRPLEAAVQHDDRLHVGQRRPVR